jgi:hypothetical protein
MYKQGIVNTVDGTLFTAIDVDQPYGIELQGIISKITKFSKQSTYFVHTNAVLIYIHQ